MARGGNDHDSAVTEIETQYGKDHQSAADLIDTHDANYDVVLQQALSKAVDEPATAALDADDIKPAYGGKVLSYGVRGGRLVVVEETPEGRLKKWHKDVPSAAKKASKAGAQAGAMPTTQQVKDQTAGAGDGDPTGGAGEAGSGQGEGEDGKAPKDVTVAKIEEQLAAEGTTPEKDVTKKDDLWALVSEEGQKALVEAAGQQS